MNTLSRDRNAIQPFYALVAVGLVIAFALVAMAAVATNENSPISPYNGDHNGNDQNGGGQDRPADEPIGYLVASATVHYSMSGSTPTRDEGYYIVQVGVGSHQGAVPMKFFFMLPEGLQALWKDFAVTFTMTYPDGASVSDTALSSAQDLMSSSGHTFQSVPFLVYENGDYALEAYFFADGQQVGGAHYASCHIDGTNWDH